MKRNWLYRGGALVLALALIVVVGCSSDDDKGTTSLTSEEQYELVEAFADAGFIEQVMVPAIVGQAGVGFWDGVDQQDVSEFIASLSFGVFGMASSAIPGVGTLTLSDVVRKATPDAKEPSLNEALAPFIQLAAAEAESVTVVYDDIKGWWFVDANITIDVDTTGSSAHLEMLLRDSVRFETASGMHMQEPDESTDRVLHGFNFSLTVDGDISDELFGNIDLDAGAAVSSFVDVGGLTTGVATLNGDSQVDADLGITADVRDTTGQTIGTSSVDGNVGIDASMTNVQLPIPQEPGGQTCPTSGSMSADFAIDLTIDTPEEKRSAKGSWEATVAITGGIAQLTVQSGDVMETITTEVCPSE